MALNPQSVLAKLNSSTSERLSTLNYLKNEVIGHTQRKEYWLRHGLVRPLIVIIAPAAFGTSNADTPSSFLTLPGTLSDEDNARLQALQLLSSFANAGPAFLPPLHAANTLPAVLSDTCLRSQHHQIVLAALRVVQDIAAAAVYASPSSPINSAYVASILFSDDHLESFHHIISQRTSDPSNSNAAQISIVAQLIKDLCHDARHQSLLVNCGILDALATKLAGFAVLEGQVLPGAEVIVGLEDLEDYMPEPTHPATGLDAVLGAIAAIISDSPFRACKLLCSPSILAVFPIVDVDPSKSPVSFCGPMELPGLAPTKHLDFEPMNLLLPPTFPHIINRTVYPSLGASREGFNRNGRSASRLHSNAASRTQSEDAFVSSHDVEGEEAESPLIPWLITLARSRTGTESLMATSVLTSLFKAGFSYKTRETNLSLLVVPVLSSMLNDLVETKKKDMEAASVLGLIEEAPAVLARLITDSEPLQKAAFESSTVKTICKLLKDSHDPLPPVSKSWPYNRTLSSTDELHPSCRLGKAAGQRHHWVHRVKVREATLKAIGALATFKEEYRKAIVDQEAIHYIVESLNQTAENPVSVVIAACYAVRMLSRSVNILRTALIDHDASTPLFKLLRHPDVELQMAAADAMCNMVMDCSPMRDSLVEAGVVEVACEHARSHHPSLRLSALWTLKHLVLSSNIELKKRCVEELQSGWLVRLICDDTEDDALFSAREKSGGQLAQDSLDDMDEDMDMGVSDDQSRAWLPTSFYKAPSTHTHPDIRILRLADSKLEVLREAEVNFVRKARHDDLAIQEQGLGLIRNLIGGACSSNNPDSPNDSTDMIDYLFTAIGQDRLFQILASKLRAKVLHSYSRRSATGSEARVLPPQTKIIESVIYILVHIAASIPRHRQVVVSQTELLRQLAKLFSSEKREVRVALCHLINNLTWQDNVNDAPACSQRALELKKLGFLNKLEALKESDDELDVRERAKSALWQMKPAY
ncbi:ARM repeat-containing protein [Hypoxylon sp. FL1284]|nr:ARM repeat-containing protein [Hypoxylon sp. FL1284]